MYIPGYFKVFETIHNYHDSNQNKYMILEPMCSILRLILYIYKDKEQKYQFQIILFNIMIQH